MSSKTVRFAIKGWCISLIAAVSAATLASGAAAMPREGSLSYAAPMQAPIEVSEPQTSAKTLTSADLELPSVDEIDTNSQVAVTATENTAATPESPANSSLESADIEVLEPINTDNLESDPMAQVTSVSQLSDVQPSDWAFPALQSIVERYGCIAGYGDRTYRGNRTLTRYEFAAGLNACLDRIEKLISQTPSNAVRQEDLAALQQMQKEYATELATLRGRVDGLESRRAQLETNQFSTTTRLNGSVIFSVLDTFSGRGDNEAVLQQQAFLSLSTSFTGGDLLSTGILASNADIPNFEPTNNGNPVGSTREGLTTWAFGGSTGNNFVIGNLEYIFPVIDKKDKLYVTLAAVHGFNTSRFLLPILSLSWEGYALGSGPVSAFAQRSPMYRLGGGSGVVANYDVGNWRLHAGYLATQGSNPSEGAGGLFNGDYVALLQTDYTSPDNRLAVALAYFNNYFSPGRFAFNSRFNFGTDSPGFVGTALANRFDNAGVFFDKDIPVVSNTYGVQAYYRIHPNLIIGGFASKISARLIERGDADIWTYALNLSFPDLGKKGNLGGIIVGVEPILTGLRVGGNFVGGFKRDTSLHVESFYKYQVTDNISITPGVIWITAPNQDADNQDIVVGLIRTTFSF